MSKKPHDDHLDFKRNRQVFFTPNQVLMDGLGGIISRPLVRNPPLPCFGLPHRYWRGEFDQHFIWHKSDGTPEKRAHGCAGCRARPACGKAALERRDSSKELRALHLNWETQTQRLLRADRYEHPSWIAFDQASRAHAWLDGHDGARKADMAKRAERERKRRKEKLKPKNKLRHVCEDLQNAILAERDRRADVLISLRTTPGAPVYVASLPPKSCKRTADMWAAGELLRRMRRRPTGKAIAEYLILNGRAPGATVAGLTTRAIEAQARIDRLESDGLWSPFKHVPIRSQTYAMP